MNDASGRPHIFITNDDGATSPGLRALIAELSPHYKLTVVVPRQPRSGISKAVSFDVPLRFTPGPTIAGQQVLETTGTPADAVIYARSQLKDISMILSGINLGLNVSLHSMLTSGTLGAAVEAALWGFPALALSIETPSHNWFFPSECDVNVEEAARRTRRIVELVLKNGLPRGVDLLNVNFPHPLDSSTPVHITSPARLRFRNTLQRRVDPQGNAYHWIAGKPIRRLPPTSDVHIAAVKCHISISPISLTLTDSEKIGAVRRLLSTLL